jgi:hypothetical protein
MHSVLDQILKNTWLESSNEKRPLAFLSELKRFGLTLIPISNISKEDMAKLESILNGNAEVPE